MVNNNSSTSGANPAGASSSSTTSGSNAGGGSSNVSAPPSGTIPAATTMPSRRFRSELTTLARGIGTQFPGDIAVVVNGQSMTQASLISTLQVVLALYGAVDTAVQSAKSSRLALEAALPGTHQFVVGIKAALIALFGKGNPALEAFGLLGTKPRQLTSEQKTARAERARQTRALRGTGGKRQKAGVKFTGEIKVQTSLVGTEIKGGNASPTPSAK